MSEYQYYEFLAVDRPLDDRQQAEVRSLSTRASITTTSFINTTPRLRHIYRVIPGAPGLGKGR